MTLISGDPLTQLAFSIYGNKGVYALLLGSGLSRSASIPTGWEITVDLVRRVALAQGVPEQTDWAGWYHTEFQKDPNYSELVEQLGLSPDERRSILHSYIEPDDQDREQHLKLPTKAHQAVARLVKDGFIKVIITTNFDRLIENALREEGVEPTVVGSVDSLLGAEPLVHSTAYLLKLHGDYKDARILNTEAELSGYPPQYDVLLDRIMDEYGLLVCGWSGEWDHALRAAIMRAPSRRYPMYWAGRGTLGNGATELVKHRRAQIIQIGGADEFFEGLDQRVQTLSRTHRQNPLGIELLVSTAKRYLGKPEFRIGLDDLVSQECRSLVGKLTSEELPTHGSWDAEQFRDRVRIYEAATEPLARIAAVVGRWGSAADGKMILDIVRSLSSHADQQQSGLTVWLYIRSYPAVLVTAAYCLGLVRAQRWQELHQFLSASLQRRHQSGSERIVDNLVLDGWSGGNNDYWTKLEGLDRRRTALSDHLCEVFKGWCAPMIGSVPDFEIFYETWEVLAAVVYHEQMSSAVLEDTLKLPPQQGFVYFPIGRSAWNAGTRETILLELQSEPTKARLLEAGFAKGSDDFLAKIITNYCRLAARHRW